MNGLFIGFRFPVRGREEAAVRVFEEHVQHFTALQERGELEAFEAVFLEPHGGDLGGFFLLRGDPERLAALRGVQEFTRLGSRAQMTVEGYGVVGASLGDEVRDALDVFRESLELT